MFLQFFLKQLFQTGRPDVVRESKFRMSGFRVGGVVVVAVVEMEAGGRGGYI